VLLGLAHHHHLPTVVFHSVVGTTRSFLEVIAVICRIVVVDL